MSGSPTEAEIQTQWRAAVNLLESTRNYIDGTVAGAAGLFDVLIQALEGDYTPAGLTGAAQRMRAALATLIDSGRAIDFLTPVFFEYGKRITAGGGGYRNLRDLMTALYEHFVKNTLTVKSRAITFDVTPTAPSGITNIGNGHISRLTLDRNNFPLEACHVENKQFRCRRDRNTGVKEHAEVFEMLALASSPDSILRASFGSGDRANVEIISKNAGTGPGGSSLTNSSFDTYSASASPKFAAWTETAGGASITQDATNYYRSNPSVSTNGVNGSLKITGGAGTVTLTQTIDAMRLSKLDPETPYFLRVMVNKTVGTAVGGNVVIRMGSVTVTTSIASLSAGWNEILVPALSSSLHTANCWPRAFNQNPFKIQVEWATSTSGYLLVDDAIFCPFDLIDGTYYCLRQNAATPTSWLLDDALEFTDTGGAPATGKVQWWLWVAGLGYLPSSGSPSFTDP